MSWDIAWWLSALGHVLAALASAYGVVAWLIARRPISSAALSNSALPPVTILKPLCGVEPETYDCLRSFCSQEYETFQIVFGVFDSNDPVIAVVRRLQSEFPHRDLQLVVDHRRHGSNLKVSNLLNMMSRVRHNLLILSDSDVRVKPDYLARVVPPLLDGGVGIVTCPYRGVSRPGLWSTLGALYINDWFMPSVRLGAAAGSQAFASGVTIGIRREVLARIGGFTAIADVLADDFAIAVLARQAGLRTVLSSVEVETIVEERTLRALVHHEIRWLRTIRALQPAGYAFLFLTFSLPVTLFQAIHAKDLTSVALLLVSLAARIRLHLTVANARASATRITLLPLRDFLTVILWALGYCSNRVQWRGRVYDIADNDTRCVIQQDAFDPLASRQPPPRPANLTTGASSANAGSSTVATDLSPSKATWGLD